MFNSVSDATIFRYHYYNHNGYHLILTYNSGHPDSSHGNEIWQHRSSDIELSIDNMLGLFLIKKIIDPSFYLEVNSRTRKMGSDCRRCTATDVLLRLQIRLRLLASILYGNWPELGTCCKKVYTRLLHPTNNIHVGCKRNAT